jgi:hypothetical protein
MTPDAFENFLLDSTLAAVRPHPAVFQSLSKPVYNSQQSTTCRGNNLTAMF